MRPEVADVKYIGKTVFQHQSVGGLCMPSPNFGWGEGLNTPAPPCSAAYCAKDAYRQSRPVLAHMDISSRAFFFGCVYRNFQKFKSKGTEKGA